MKALTETSNVEPARGDRGFAGLAEDITGNAGLPAQVDRSVFATPGELVIRRFRRRRLHRIPSRRMLLEGTTEHHARMLSVAEQLSDPVSRRRNGVRAKFARFRTRTLARRLPELTFSAR